MVGLVIAVSLMVFGAGVSVGALVASCYIRTHDKG
jgi:hypothetical protein